LYTLFEGSGLDVYIHWLILWLGILVLVSGAAVLISCRTIAAAFNLLGSDGSRWSRLYLKFYRYHSVYWIVFGLVLALHLLMTITHVGFPENPFLASHIVVFITAITNFILATIVLSSCRTAVRMIGFFTSKNPLESSGYKHLYKYHAYYWWLLGLSLATHIVFGMIHAVNT
jgi:hypothetical protein